MTVVAAEAVVAAETVVVDGDVTVNEGGLNGARDDSVVPPPTVQAPTNTMHTQRTPSTFDMTSIVPETEAGDAGIWLTPGMSQLRHIALLRFKTGTTDDQIQAVLDGLATMPGKMGFIRRYEFGRDVGIVEGNPQVAVVADFDSADDWRAYQDYPDHQVLVKEVISPILDSITRVQYEVD